MTPSRQAIATMSTRYVSFAHDKIALRKSLHMFAGSIDDAHKLVTDDQRYRNRFLCPSVPVVNMHVGSADRCFQDADQHVVAANVWDRHLLQPQPRLGLGLDDGLHRFLHEWKLSTDSAISQRIVIRIHHSICDRPRNLWTKFITLG